MKIAIFTDLLIPPDGGIEQHILAICEQLAKRGHEAKIFTPSPSKKDFSGLPRNYQFSLPDRQAGIFNFQFGIPMPYVWPNFRLAFPLHLYFQLRKWRPDVVHFHTAGPLSLAGVILAKILKIRIVGTFHSYFASSEYLQNFQFLKWTFLDEECHLD